MKALVSPVGSFMYITNEPGITIVPERPTLVRVDEFIRTLGLQKKIEQVGGKFPDEATDAEWALFLKSSVGNTNLALDSFHSKWEGLDEESLAQQAEKTRIQLAEEARRQAEEDNRRAQEQLLADAAERTRLEKETAEALAASEKLAEEKKAEQAKIDAQAKEAAEAKAKADVEKKGK